MPEQTEDQVFEAYRCAKAANEETDVLVAELYKLVREHAGAVVWNTLGENPSDDILSNITNAVVMQLDRFRGDAKFSTWVHGIAKRLCYKEIRRRVRHPETALDAMDSTELENLVQTVEDPESRLYLGDVFKLLSDEEKELVLAKFHGEENDEIAQRLGLKEVAIRQRMFRLRQRLSKNLGEERAA